MLVVLVVASAAYVDHGRGLDRALFRQGEAQLRRGSGLGGVVGELEGGTTDDIATERGGKHAAHGLDVDLEQQHHDLGRDLHGLGLAQHRAVERELRVVLGAGTERNVRVAQHDRVGAAVRATSAPLEIDALALERRGRILDLGDGHIEPDLQLLLHHALWSARWNYHTVGYQ